MTTTRDRIETNADLVMWCVHILGPDDMLAAPCHEAAAVRARELNKALHGKPSTPDDILCFAYAAPWPYGREGHNKGLMDWNTK
jgi:hypothetical protein